MYLKPTLCHASFLLDMLEAVRGDAWAICSANSKWLKLKKKRKSAGISIRNLRVTLTQQRLEMPTEKLTHLLLLLKQKKKKKGTTKKNFCCGATRQLREKSAITPSSEDLSVETCSNLRMWVWSVTTCWCSLATCLLIPLHFQTQLKITDKARGIFMKFFKRLWKLKLKYASRLKKKERKEKKLACHFPLMN